MKTERFQRRIRFVGRPTLGAEGRGRDRDGDVSGADISGNMAL